MKFVVFLTHVSLSICFVSQVATHVFQANLIKNTPTLVDLTRRSVDGQVTDLSQLIAGNCYVLINKKSSEVLIAGANAMPNAPCQTMSATWVPFQGTKGGVNTQAIWMFVGSAKKGQFINVKNNQALTRGAGQLKTSSALEADAASWNIQLDSCDDGTYALVKPIGKKELLIAGQNAQPNAIVQVINDDWCSGADPSGPGWNDQARWTLVPLNKLNSLGVLGDGTVWSLVAGDSGSSGYSLGA